MCLPPSPPPPGFVLSVSSSVPPRHPPPLLCSPSPSDLPLICHCLCYTSTPVAVSAVVLETADSDALWPLCLSPHWHALTVGLNQLNVILYMCAKVCAYLILFICNLELYLMCVCATA